MTDDYDNVPRTDNLDLPLPSEIDDPEELRDEWGDVLDELLIKRLDKLLGEGEGDLDIASLISDAGDFEELSTEELSIGPADISLTDDDAETSEDIQDAIDSLPDDGGVVSLSGRWDALEAVHEPDNTGAHVAAILLPDNVTLDLRGAYLSLADDQGDPDDTAYPQLIANSDYDGNEGATIIGGTLDANGDGQTNWDDEDSYTRRQLEAIEFVQTEGYEVLHTTAMNARGDGIDFDDCREGKVIGGRYIGNGGYGVHLSTTYDNLVMGVTTIENGLEHERAGIDAASDSEGEDGRNTIIGCHSIRDYHGLHARRGPSLFSNCQIKDPAGHAVMVGDVDDCDTEFINIKMDGGEPVDGDAGDDGYRIENSGKTTIRGGEIVGFDRGIHASSNAEGGDITIDGTQIENSRHAIRARVGMTINHIEVDETSDYALYIRVDGAEYSGDLKMTGGEVKGSADDTIRVDDWDGRLEFKGTTILDSEGRGFYTDPGLADKVITQNMTVDGVVDEAFRIRADKAVAKGHTVFDAREAVSLGGSDSIMAENTAWDVQDPWNSDDEDNIQRNNEDF